MREQDEAPNQAGPPVETAFAMPRTGALAGPDEPRDQPGPGEVRPGSGWTSSEVPAPHPLDDGEAARIRAIFALQQAGRMDAAMRATRALHDTSLLGDILADRYLGSADSGMHAGSADSGMHAGGADSGMHAGSADSGNDLPPDRPALRDWLRRWPDLPDASAIRRLLSGAPTQGEASPAATPGALDADAPASAPPEEADPLDHEFVRNPLLDRTIQARLNQGSARDAAGARSALRLVAATRFPDPLYAATLRAEIAQRLFTAGDTALAARTARLALQQSGGRIGLAAYVGGLSAWRQDRIAPAQGLFEQGSRDPLTAASTRAAAAFWAARTHARLHDAAGSHLWMERAAASSDTFYGMLARRVLDQSANPIRAAADSVPLHPGAGVLGEVDVEAVAATMEGRRAFALLEVGQPGRAEAALRQLWPRAQNDVALCRSIALVAQTASMTGLAAQLATILQSRDGQPRDQARFPVPRLRPAQGFTVNPALVYALTRLESNFNTRAVSGAGAHGLMQIMPVTADFVLGKAGHAGHRAAGTARALHNPGFNLEIGQRYLRYLAGEDTIHGNLIRLLASYNAGPNALAQWGDGDSTATDDDPLLFIETLPVRETRDFVHRALSYLWIYDARMKLPAPSLDTLAEGGWPRFEDEQKMAAARPDFTPIAR